MKLTSKNVSSHTCVAFNYPVLSASVWERQLAATIFHLADAFFAHVWHVDRIFKMYFLTFQVIW